MTTSTLVYDSLPEQWPETAEYILAYVDGHISAGNYAAARAARPAAHVIGITVTGQPGHAVADVENGDLSFEGGAIWAQRELGQGRHPTLYVGLANWPALKDALTARRVDVARVQFLVAEYGADPAVGSEPVVPEGAIGKQYQSTAAYDTSIVLRSWSALPAVVEPSPVVQEPLGEPAAEQAEVIAEVTNAENVLAAMTPDERAAIAAWLNERSELVQATLAATPEAA